MFERVFKGAAVVLLEQNYRTTAGTRVLLASYARFEKL